MRLPPTSDGPGLPGRAWLALPAWVSDGDGKNPDNELQSWSSLIGIVTAICGNVLIALALNVQRYAHIRLQRKRAQIRERAKQAMKSATAAAHDQGAGVYGAAQAPNGESNGRRDGPANGSAADQYSLDDVRDSSETAPLAQSFHSDSPPEDADKAGVASTYLKDPYWWLGQVLITVGEMGNFLAYGFAPASIVSPLGVVALVSNCVIAPIFFKEVFRQRDFWGVIVAITGAVTVVLSAKTEETKLGPHEVWGAITTMEFEIYMAVSCALIVLLVCLSPRYGHRTILIDLGLVGLFGGYTVLSTKGVSSMLSSSLLGAFATPVTYVLVFILLFTAVMQVRYVNKALQRFDSTQVIPIQFVLFTLSVITGSAVLYRDFERTTAEQAVKFVGGCLFTFFGVFLITSGRPRQAVEDEATLSDAEGIEETISLAEQDRAPPPTPPQRRRAASPAGSRGSSRVSRVSFRDTVNRPFAALTNNTRAPTSRIHPGTSPRKPFFEHDDSDSDDENSAMLGNPWQDCESLVPPAPGRHTISSDSTSSVVHSAPIPSDSEQATAKTTKPLPPIPIPATPPRISFSAAANEPPSTPRVPATTSRLPPHHVYSPSPFSSTVSAVVGDTLLAHAEYAGGTSSTPAFTPTQGAAHGQWAGAEAGSGAEAVGERGENSGVDASEGGLRARARSLSLTLGLGGLFGGVGGHKE